MPLIMVCLCARNKIIGQVDPTVSGFVAADMLVRTTRKAFRLVYVIQFVGSKYPKNMLLNSENYSLLAGVKLKRIQGYYQLTHTPDCNYAIFQHDTACTQCFEKPLESSQLSFMPGTRLLEKFSYYKGRNRMLQKHYAHHSDVCISVPDHLFDVDVKDGLSR